MELTPEQHGEEAERLLAQGVDVINKIDMLDKVRQGIQSRTPNTDFNSDNVRSINGYTNRIEELGKKAMGIWAQAQVHATLATMPFQQVETRSV